MSDSALTLEEAVASAGTGDIWLFRGRSLADRAIQAVTNSPVNHVGMVVALDDLPPLLWHAELGRSLPDVWTGQRQRGVQLHKLRDAVTTWDERYGQKAWVRHLEGAIQREHEDRLIKVIERLFGRMPRAGARPPEALAPPVSRSERLPILVAPTACAVGLRVIRYASDRPMRLVVGLSIAPTLEGLLYGISSECMTTFPC